MSLPIHELPEHEEPAPPARDVNAPDYGQLPGPPRLVRVHRGQSNPRGVWLIADVHLEMQLGTDRVGNPQLSIMVQLEPGTDAGTTKDEQGRPLTRRLSEPVRVPIYLDPQSLAHLAWRTLGNSGGKATSGALRAKRGMKRLAITLEPQK